MTKAEAFIDGGVCASCGYPQLAGHAPSCQREQKEAREAPVEIFTEYCDVAVEDALDYVRTIYDFNLHEQNFLFHNSEHTQTVIDRAQRILETLQQAGMDVDERDIALGRVAAAWHDVIQSWETNEDWPEGSDDAKYGKVMRVRRREENESASVDGAITFLRGINERSDVDVFLQEDFDRLKEAGMGTVPGFDPEKATVVQPNAEHSQDVIVRAVALADLGDAGMGGPEAYLEAGDNLFVEENMDMWDLDLGSLDDDQKQYYRNRMLAWNGFQPKFAEGRQKKLDDELATLPEDVRGAVRELFPHFDASIAAARQRFAVRKEMTFEELYRDMGFVAESV